jgi:two-component system, cell cycle sensor histidine kinase and response regulator CckA
VVTPRKPKGPGETKTKTGARTKKTGAALEAATAGEQALLDASPDLTLLLDRDGNVLAANDAVAARFGGEKKDLIGACLWDLLQPELAALLRERLAQAFAGPNPVVYTDLIAGCGFESRVRPVLDDQGAVTRVAVFARDVTDQQRAVLALRESDEKHRLLLDESPDPIFSFLPDGTYHYVNRAFAESVGKPIEQIVGRRIWDVFEKGEAEQRFAALSEVFRTGKAKTIEVRVPRPDGERYYVTTITPVLGSGGEVVSALCSSKDVTERWQAEDLLREEHALALALATATTVEEALEACVRSAIRLSGMDCGGAYLVRDGGLELVFHTGLAPEFVEKCRHYSPDSPNTQIVMAGKAHYSSPRSIPGTTVASVEAAGIDVLAVVPISHQGTVVACLNLASYRLTSVSEPARRALEAMAGHVGSAVAGMQAREAQRASETKFLKAFHASPVVIGLTTLQDGRFVEVNDRFCEVLGYSREDVIGKTTAEVGVFVEPEQRFRIRDAVQAVGRLTGVALQMRTRDGRILDGLTSAEVLSLEGRLHLITTMIDMTEHRRAEEALRASEEKFRTITEQTGDLIALTDGAGVVTYASAMARTLFLLAPEEMIGRHFMEFLDQPSIPVAMSAFQAAMATGKDVKNLELTMKRCDGSVFDGELNGSQFHLGDQASSLVVIRDVTERKKTDRERFESLTRFYGFAEASQYGMGMADLDGHIIYVNRTLARMLGEKAPKDCLGKHFPTVYYSKADARRLQEDVLPALMRDGHWHGELALVTEDGRMMPTDENYFVLRDELGRPCYLADILTDITERKEAEEALRLSNARLASLARIAQYRADSMEGLLDFALEEAISLTGSALGYIYRYSEEDRLFTLNTWSRGVMEECSITDSPTVYELDKTGLWGEVVRQRVPIMVNDFSGPHPLKQGYPEGHAPLRKFLTVPVLAGDRIVAVVGVANKAADYTQPDVEQLTLLMDSVWKIVERQEAEVREHESQRRLAEVIDFLPDATFVIDVQGRVIAWNKEMEVLTGVPAREILGKSDQEYSIHFYGVRRDALVDLALRDATADDRYTDFRRKGDVLEGEAWLPAAKSGMFCYATASALRDSSGAIVGAIECVRDITEQKKAGEALRASEERYRYLADNISDVVWIRDFSNFEVMPFLYASPSVAHLMGCPYEQAVKTPLKDLLPPKELARLLGVFAREFPAAVTADRHRVWIEETEHIRSDGVHVPVEMAMKLVFDEAGVPYGLMGVTRDITERKKAEAEMRGLHERFSKAFHRNPTPMFISRLDDGRFIDVNRAFDVLLGRDGESLIGATSTELDLHTTDTGDGFTSLMAERGQLRDVATTLTTRRGTTVDVLVSAEPMEIGGVPCILGALVDITESKRAQAEKEHLEDQLRQATKMEAVGRLAGGVAHDFNNLLTVILGYTRMLLCELNLADPMRDDLQEVQNAAERASTLTSQLLAFSRKQVIAPRVQSLNEIIEGARRMLLRIIGEDVQLEAILKPELPQVKVDSSQVDQILVNLAVNARDAMPDGGKLTLETQVITADETYCRLHTGMKPGAYVLLAVSDNGCGMNEATRQRIFDPFFTTKGTGKGTGLGLAMVYGAVQQNGGFINVYSEPGVGTTFKIFLPVVEADAMAEAAAQPSIDMLPRGMETILLVEDEEMVRRLARMVLQRQGYHILETSGGQEAIDLCRDHDGPIDLLLTDVIMPGMNGKALLNVLQSIRSGLKVLFMSGYTENVVAHHGVLDAGTNFIQKPFSIEDLSRKVREALRDG